MTRVTAILAGTAVVALLAGTLWYTLGRAPDDAFAACREGQIAGGTGSIGGPFTLVNGAGETVTDIQLKSIITQPLNDASLQQGTIVVLGAAYAGEGRVSGVEVSVDGGNSWQAASFIGPQVAQHSCT